MTTNSTDQLLAAGQRSSVIRTGTVTQVTATTLSVLVGASNVTSSYFENYDAQIGDLVAIARQDSTWVTLGRFSGSGPNLVNNPSFELDGELTGVPSLWGLQNLVGVSTVSVVPFTGAPGGLYVAQINQAAGARDSVLYSSAIDVLPGQVYAVSAYVAGLQAPGVPTADAILQASWHALETDVPPTQTVVPTTIVTMLNVPNALPFYQLSGTVAVPATGTLYMRIGLRSTVAANVGMQWDFCTARLISDA